MEDFQAGIIKTGVFFSISDCWLRKYSGFLFLNQIYQKLCHILCQIGSQKSHMPFPCILKVGIFLHFRQRRLQIFRACREQIGFYDQLIDLVTSGIIPGCSVDPDFCQLFPQSAEQFKEIVHLFLEPDRENIPVGEQSDPAAK